MSISAANSAGLLGVSLCPWSWTNQSFISHNLSNHYRRSFCGDASSSGTAIRLDFREPSAHKNFTLKRVYRFVSVLCAVTASGLFRRPAVLGLLLRIARPFGVPVPPKTSLQSTAKNALQTFFGSLPESRPSALGSRSLSLASLNVTPSNNGRIQQTETLSCFRTK